MDPMDEEFMLEVELNFQPQIECELWSHSKPPPYMNRNAFNGIHEGEYATWYMLFICPSCGDKKVKAICEGVRKVYESQWDQLRSCVCDNCLDMGPAKKFIREFRKI